MATKAVWSTYKTAKAIRENSTDRPIKRESEVGRDRGPKTGDRRLKTVHRRP
jgi:hypothetical protein